MPTSMHVLDVLAHRVYCYEVQWYEYMQKCVYSEEFCRGNINAAHVILRHIGRAYDMLGIDKPPYIPIDTEGEG